MRQSSGLSLCWERRGSAATLPSRPLVGAESTSAVVDVALDRLIHLERLRRDIAAYQSTPPGEEALALAELAALGELDDEADWAALYSDT